jgi:hypothetical protein
MALAATTSSPSMPLSLTQTSNLHTNNKLLGSAAHQCVMYGGGQGRCGGRESRWWTGRRWGGSLWSGAAVSGEGGIDIDEVVVVVVTAGAGGGRRVRKAGGGRGQVGLRVEAIAEVRRSAIGRPPPVLC